MPVISRWNRSAPIARAVTGRIEQRGAKRSMIAPLIARMRRT
jgi:hypothetical protein